MHNKKSGNKGRHEGRYFTYFENKPTNYSKPRQLHIHFVERSTVCSPDSYDSPKKYGPPNRPGQQTKVNMPHQAIV